MTDLVQIERDGRVLKVTLNRADKKNALTYDMYAALVEAMEQANEDAAIHALYITGSGDAFTAGNDLMDFRDNPPLSPDAPVNRFLGALPVTKKPVIMAVNGMAVGVGLTMTLHADIVIMAQSAFMTAPFVDLALVPEAASSLLLPKLVGHAVAADIFLTGRRVSADEALAIGLVSRVVPDDRLQTEGLNIAHAVAKKAPESVRQTRELMRGDVEAITSRMKLEGKIFGERLMSPELFEAIAAFSEKRDPDFG